MPPTARTGSPRPPWRAAWAAVAALSVWAVIDVFGTVIAVGHYEDRITMVTHGEVDVLPAWLVYTTFDHFMPYGMVTMVAARLWMLGLLVAGIAVSTWLVQARRNAGRLGGAPAWATATAAPVGRWWASVIVMVLLNGLVALYSELTSHGGLFAREAVDTRVVAYPLWTAATVAVVSTAVLSGRVVLRITETQEQATYAKALAYGKAGRREAMS